MCRLNYVRGDTETWLVADDEIEDYDLRLHVLRHGVFWRHCEVGMAVTELFLICRNPKCGYKIGRALGGN